MANKSTLTKRSTPKTGSERLASFRARGRILERPVVSARIKREREALEADTPKWLRKIFPGIYRQPFGDVHYAIIGGVDYVIDHGGRYVAIAPRGSGKTFVLAGCILKAIVQRRKRFPALIPWSDSGLKKALSFWKKALCFNREFARLYPEWCFPFVASRGTSQRCATYTDADGNPYGAQLLISEGMIVFPDSLAVVAGATLNGNPLGMNYTTDSGEGLRPDVAMIDDPQDRDTALSATQIRQTIQMIDQDIAGMAGADSSMPMMMAATVKQVNDVADHYSKEWQCVRIPQITAWPKNMDLWEEWNVVRQDGERAKDKDAAALAFYAANKATMTEEMAVSWMDRYARPSGKSAGHPDAFYSAMHDYYQMGHDAFMSERQNEPVDPVNKAGPYALTVETIMSRTSQRPAMERPDWVTHILASTDINPSYALSTVVLGFGQDQSAAVLWYGIHPLAISGNMQAAEHNRLIYQALMDHGRSLGGMPCRPETWVIDAGGTNFDPVIRYAGESARVCGIPALAFTGRGAKQYKPYGKTLVPGLKREQCHGCLDRKEGRVIRWVAWNADYWREVAQRAWLGDIGAPGSVSLPVGQHRDFAMQIASERLLGKGDVGGMMLWNWTTLPGKHDFGDCMAQGYAAAAYGGIGTGGMMQTRRINRPRGRKVSVISL